MLSTATALGLVATLLVTGAASQPTKRTPTIATTNYRSSGTVNDESGTSYNYAPAIIFDHQNLYRMWWCGNPGSPGDHILYAQSTSLDGPFTSVDGTAGWQSVFQGTGIGTGTFDARHTCDPNIVLADGTYYMYYGALKEDNDPGLTTMGVASSPDGISWTRLNNGNAILTPAFQQANSSYGVGQPAVVYRDGLFWMLFIDTTGSGTQYGNGLIGNSIFAWRSADPTFQTGVEVFLQNGWTAKTDANSRSFSVFVGSSVDWQFSNVINSWIVANDQHTTESTTISFLDPDNLLVHKYNDVEINGHWTEGPGLVRLPDGTDIVPRSDCSILSLDVIRSTTEFPPTTLQHIGLDVLTGLTSCPQL